jgi:lipid A 3-O-deacylase
MGNDGVAKGSKGSHGVRVLGGDCMYPVDKAPTFGAFSVRLTRSAVLVAGLTAGACWASPALAGDPEPISPLIRLDEIRLGSSYHSIEGWPNEHGVDETVEALFGAPVPTTPVSLTEFFLHPRVHFGGSLNTFGDTSQIYAGLTWDYFLNDWLFIEGTFGGALHDGPLHESHRASYGCRANFRESAGVGVRLGGRWRLLAEIDHMSQAQLCDDHNSGLTNVGLKLGYVLGETEPSLK